jgi:hypothetical protein
MNAISSNLDVRADTPAELIPKILKVIFKLFILVIHKLYNFFKKIIKIEDTIKNIMTLGEKRSY